MDLDYFGPRAGFRLVVFHFKYLLVSWNNHRLVKKLVRREIHASFASFPEAAGGDNIWPITLLPSPSFFGDKFHSFALTYFSRTSRGNNNRGIFLIPPPRPEEEEAESDRSFSSVQCNGEGGCFSEKAENFLGNCGRKRMMILLASSLLLFG